MTKGARSRLATLLAKERARSPVPRDLCFRAGSNFPVPKPPDSASTALGGPETQAPQVLTPRPRDASVLPAAL